jgi:hypothetical protein
MGVCFGNGGSLSALDSYVNLTRTPRMPYCLGVRWQHLIIFVPAISLLCLSISLGGWREQLLNKRSLITWFDAGILALVLGFLLCVIFKRVVFTENEIEYHFFWIHRRYRYEEFEAIGPSSDKDPEPRFLFRGNRAFCIALTYQDVDNLLAVLKDKAPNALPGLLNLRDKLPGRRPGIRPSINEVK